MLSSASGCSKQASPLNDFLMFCERCRCALFVRAANTQVSFDSKLEKTMFTKLMAASVLSLGFVLASVGAVDKTAKDCYSRKLACCKTQKACCVADAKLGCCEKGAKCCEENRACCAAIQKCCIEGMKCCNESKACCGEKTTATKTSCCSEGQSCCIPKQPQTA
jgi:hypothetical protein